MPDGKQVLIVDWKTGRGPADPGQLAVYAQAWVDETGLDITQVAAGFFHVPDARFVPVDLGAVVTPAQLLATLES